jgi:CMP-N-acetylneuraminic acid synthetase
MKKQMKNILMSLNHKSFLAIIPARGGSKRLPNKNLLDINGKPLIEWSINAAKNSKYIDKILLSSDNDKILSTQKNTGISLIKRPDILSTDTSTTFDAIQHSIERYPGFDYIVLLQPTSPLRETKHIDEAIELLFEKNADAIVSVCEMEHNPLWSNVIPDNGDMKNFMDKALKNTRSQDLDKYFRLNGAIYICDIKELLQEKTFFIKDKIYSYLMSKEDSIDIDEELDYEIAKIIMNKRNKNANS